MDRRGSLKRRWKAFEELFGSNLFLPLQTLSSIMTDAGFDTIMYGEKEEASKVKKDLDTSADELKYVLQSAMSAFDSWRRAHDEWRKSPRPAKVKLL